MRKLTVLHSQRKVWVPAQRQVEPRLNIRGRMSRGSRTAAPGWIIQRALNRSLGY